MSNFNCIPSREEEYETQLYGFSCNDLLVNVEEDVHDQLEAKSKTMSKAMSKLAPSANKEELEKNVNAWVEKCRLTVKDPIKKLKEQLDAFFSLPPHVLIQKDKRQRETYTQEDEENIKAKINEQKSRIRRAKFLQAVFENELNKVNQVEQEVKLLEEVIVEVKSLKGVNADVEQSSKNCHKVVQTVLGLEVKEASLKLSDRPSCAENELILEEAIYED